MKTEKQTRTEGGYPSGTRVFLRPADGLQVRRPDGPPLAAEGQEILWSPYWERRLRDGDIVILQAGEVR